MIKKLQLENFQSHKNSVLDFSPGINAITGVSDSGKSAILRGFRYAVFNQPSQNNYPSHWIKNKKGYLEDTCSISIVKESGAVIRYKTRTENGYITGSETYKAINRDVPDAVRTFFNISDINIQNQLDSHFLLSSSSGEVARFLNELVDLDEIDLYLSSVEKKKRSCKKDLESTLSEIEGVCKRLSKFDWVEDAQELLSIYEENQNALKLLETNKLSLTSLVISYKELQKKQDALPDLKMAQVLVSEIDKINKELSAVLDSFDYLSKSKFNFDALSSVSFPDLKKAKSICGKIEELQRNIPTKWDSFTRLNLITMEYRRANTFIFPDLEKAKSVCGKIEKIISIISRKNDMEEKLGESQNQYNAITTKEVHNKLKLEELQKQLPEKCPLCGGSI